LSRVLDGLTTADPQSVALAIGPEGGFSASEIERAVAQDWQRVDLGQRILRVETAALALVAAVLGRVDGC
jgi:16S rRNA (uracil1498-N3)-methyltransferase